jgi:hypothetical protein
MNTPAEHPTVSCDDTIRNDADVEIFDAPLYLSALIMAPMSVVVLLANLFGVLISGIWLLFLKQWNALGIGIGAMFGATLIATLIAAVLVMPSFLIAAPAALFTKGRLKFIAIPFLVVSNVWWSVALVGWGALALWGVPQLGAQKAFIPLVIWSYEIATVPWVALLKIAGYDYKKDGGFAIFHLGVFAFGYIIAVFLVLLWGASIGAGVKTICWFSGSAYLYSTTFAVWRAIKHIVRE